MSATVHELRHFEDGSFTVPTLPLTEDALRRHADRFGWDIVEEVARWAGITLEQPKQRRNAKRISEVQRLHQEHLSIREIAFRTQLHQQTVRRYLSEPSQNGSTKPSKTPSTASNGARKVNGLPPAWDTPRKRRLGERITRLADSGLMPMAIADRLGKTDAIVRRYLREADKAGLLA